MMDPEVVLQALNALCTDGAISFQTQGRDVGVSGGTVLQSQCISNWTLLASWSQPWTGGKPTDVVWSANHLDPEYNRDFTMVKDTKSFTRGGEEYKRPCGWQRFGLKVLDKYENTAWLGHTGRRTETESVPGEWPVSFHGTKAEFVNSIVDENFKAGDRKRYGRGVYSTPDIKIAEGFAKQFPYKGHNYKVIMQSRINPEYREECSRAKYWLVPIKNKSEEQEIVKKAIRPYGILLKKLDW